MAGRPDTLWTLPEARALHAALGAYADALPDEPADGRSRGQKMADCLVDLVLRPGESGLPPAPGRLPAGPHRPPRPGPAPAHGRLPAGHALDRFVRARDRRCRFPGCRRPVPRRGELDHHQPHPAGARSAADLVGYCTGHHRAKHPAPGWRHTLLPCATLAVTTPSGLTTTTAPPPY